MVTISIPIWLICVLGGGAIIFVAVLTYKFITTDWLNR
jgi:hypothetical protein